MRFEREPVRPRRKTRDPAPKAGRSAPRCLLVDLDDTLFDHRGTARRVLVAFRRRHPSLRRRPIARLEVVYDRALDAVHGAVVAGSIGVGEARALRMRALFADVGEALAPAEASRRGVEWRRLYQQQRKPVPGAAAFLRYVHRRARIVVVSNNRKEEQREKLRFLGLSEVVDDLVTSEEIGVAKPDPRLFRAALRRGGTKPEAAVVLGDRFESDVRGALRAGLPVVWLNRAAGRPGKERSAVPRLRSLRPAAAAWNRLVESWRRERLRRRRTSV